jgi:hypothetical protein
MAYETFIPTVWNESLIRELERKHVFALHCNRDYEGDVKELGDSVRILNVGRPTIHSTTTDSKYTFQTNLNDAETINNSSITMPIKQIRYYRYIVGDIDKAQMKNSGKVMSAYQKETAEGLANEIDKYLGQTVFETAPKFTNTYSNATYGYIKVTSGDSATAAADAAQNVLELLDDILQKARENDIADSVQLYAECSPKLYKLARKALIKLSTDNVKIIEGKEYLKYDNLLIEWTNNIKTVDAVAEANAAYESLVIRTDRAVAFVHPLTHAEPYRPEDGFADALKGFILFDGMVTRPKEIYKAFITY